MSGPVRVPLCAIAVIHDRQIARHGGAAGTRDATLLEMGCARAMNLAAYGEPSLEEIAAADAFGVAEAHTFVEGNKRTAFVAAVTLPRLNGLVLRPEPAEGVRMMEGPAAGAVAEAQLAAWLARGTAPL